MSDAGFSPLSSQNLFDHVTIGEGGVGGLENIIENSVMRSVNPSVRTTDNYIWAKETHYRNSLIWGDDSVGVHNSAVECRFKDSVLAESGPFSSSYRIKPAYATMADDGTEPGMFGGKFPIRLVGNPDDLIPLMPLPWLKTVALERLRVKPSDSVKVFLEAQSGR